MNVIFLGLTNGIKDLAITFVPSDSSVIFSTTLVRKPVLCKSLLVVSTVWMFCPLLRVNLLTVPLQVVSQAFQTVPIAFLFALNTALKLPSTFIIKSGLTSVSNHSSPAGDKSIIPLKLATRNGWTFSTLVAYGCSVKVVDV